MLNGTNVPEDGSELCWCGTVLCSNGKNKGGDQGSSPQPAA